MASIARRPDGRWRPRYRDAAGKEHSKHFDRKVDAQRWLDQVTSSMVTGTYIDPVLARVTVEEWGTRWLDGHAAIKPSTKTRYESLFRVHVLPRWGTVPVSAVNVADVEAWLSQLTASGLAASSVRHAYRVLALILEHAVRAGRLPRNPVNGASLPRARRAEKRFLTHAQLQDLAIAAGGDRLIIEVLGYTGLRFGELAALRVGRVDLMRRRLEVAESVTEIQGRAVFGTPKTHHRRSVPFPRSLLEPLTALVAGRLPDELLFTGPGGGMLRVGNFRRRVFDEAARQAGLDGLTPHELRHTAASLAVSAGANVKAVQRLLGHASAAMTLDVYSGLFDDDLDAVADRLDEAAVRARADPVRTDRTVSYLDEGHIRR
ncbi:MAG TPA: tyrosine-type recombinase/integrase [Blastococcus sp.]